MLTRKSPVMGFASEPTHGGAWGFGGVKVVSTITSKLF